MLPWHRVHHSSGATGSACVMRQGTLDSAASTSGRPRLSRCAVAAPFIALLGFPLLLHWVIEQELIDFCRATGMDHHALLSALLLAWPVACALPSAVSFFRLRRTQPAGRGRGLALLGLMISCFWLSLGALVLFAPRGPMGP